MHPHPEYASSTATSTSTTPPSTIDMPTTTATIPASTASSTASEVPHAVFIYPTSLLTVNNIDIVQVGYRTVWDSVNLTVFCEMGEHSNEFSLAKINNSKLACLEKSEDCELIYVAGQSNGTYAIAPIQAGMDIPQFPTYCNFMLCNAENNTDYTTGPGFTMISTQGLATTYALAATQASTYHSSTSKTSSLSPSTATSTNSALTSAASVTSSTATQTALASTVNSTGLSGGAKAGIAIGVLLGIAAIIVAFFFFMRMKRRIDKLETMVALRSTASSVNVTPGEKSAIASSLASPRPLPSPSPPPDGCGPRMEMFKIGESHRNSEDWRRFFGNGKSQTPTAPS